MNNIQNTGRLAGKVAIVTGAGSGIGRASATLFAAEGAQVMAVDLSAEGLEGTAAAIAATGASCQTLCADVSDEEAVKAYIEQTIRDCGKLDIIYANAGISGGAVPLVEQDVALWEQVLRVNLIGPFLAIKHGAPAMVSQGKGSIVCTASVAGLRANAGGAPYSASKAGVISLVQTSANQFYGSGVRFNAICPGLIETGMTQPIFDGARSRGREDKIGQLNPTARYGNPVEIANMALFLASDEASYVNGQAIAVDGGLSSTLPFVAPRR
ncbi:MAG: NAD(P)-dependent dehydrogenase (short-subunit alcohol dehydrogenase family) [Paraglaciecola psychrophila]|jgi:NAD(P)-dependent dehydrogenase (short-subunit alcohol dehydrogenase family)